MAQSLMFQTPVRAAKKEMETHTLALAPDRIVEEEQDDRGDEIPEIEALAQVGGITMLHLTMKRKRRECFWFCSCCDCGFFYFLSCCS